MDLKIAVGAFIKKLQKDVKGKIKLDHSFKVLENPKNLNFGMQSNNYGTNETQKRQAKKQLLFLIGQENANTVQSL